MKKILFILLCFVCANVSYADQTQQQVTMHQQGASNKHNRNEEVPLVTYNPNENTLSVEFEAEGSFTLIVEDAYGQVQYSAPVVTDGNSYSHYVNLLPENYYVITITSVDESYIGFLETEAE